MNEKRKVYALVPARSGSKGILDKNIQVVGSKTLIEHAILFGLKVLNLNEVFISTDSAIYEDLAIKAGASSFGLRRKEIAGDSVKMADVIDDFISKVEVNLNVKEDFNIVLLQPTSPFRFLEDTDLVNGGLLQCSEEISCFSCSLIEEPHPYKTFRISNDSSIIPLKDFNSLSSPRQELEKTYQFDGAFYIFSASFFKRNRTLITAKSKALISDKRRVNIDSFLDLELAKSQSQLLIHYD